MTETALAPPHISSPSHRGTARAAAAGFALAAVAVALLPPGPALMGGLTLLVFFALKWLSLNGFRNRPWPQAFLYLSFWPGMDPRAFFAPRRRLRAPLRSWAAALGKTVLALVVLREVLPAWTTADPLWTGIAGMGVLILLFHCGLFHLLALAWQTRGVPVTPIMRAPLQATSATDFWGSRWNLAFRDFVHRHLFRALAPRWGVAGATMAVFLFSGLVHDLVISCAAAGGYGLPTLYFLIQGAAVLAERTRLGRKLAGRVTTALVLLLPLPLLFHRPFGAVVIVPILEGLAKIGS